MRNVYIIKTQTGEFAHANSIKVIEGETLFISYKAFSQECRAYINLEAGEKALAKLKSDVKDAGLNYSFHIEYVDLDKIIRIATSGDDNNMIIKIISTRKVA